MKPQLRVGDAMTRNVWSISPDDTVHEAALQMRNRNVGTLPVIEDYRLVGMVTDRDITVRGTAEGRDPLLTSVRQVMTPEVYACTREATLEEAARTMEEHGVRRLVILDSDGGLAGILSVDDIALALSRRELVGEILGRLIAPPPPVS